MTVLLHRRLRHLTASAGLSLALVLATAACGAGGSSKPAVAKAPPTTTGGPLVAPKTDPAEDAHYLTDLAEADPDLSSYVNEDGNVALQALLTDGAAFCAFLSRGGGIDSAMESLAVGAQTVEARTHLPQSVTTFNAIDAVALLTLCPSDQKLIPAADQATINKLGASLAGASAQAG